MMNIKKDIKKTRTENAIRNIIAGICNNIITLLLPFFVRTFLLYDIGVDYIGINSLYTSIFQVLNVTELGFTSAVIYSLYEPVARNDINKITAKISLLRTVYKFIGTIILVIGLIILPFISLLINGIIPENVNIYVVYIIFLFNTVISYFVYGYKNAILTVYQRNDLISKTNTFIIFIKSFLQIVILVLFKNFYAYVILLPITTLLGNLIINHMCNNLYPELNKNYRLTFDGLREMIKPVVGIAIGRISLVCRNSFDSIILSTLFGLTTIAIYSNYYYVFSSISGFMVVLSVSISASIGNSLVTESIEKNEKDHIRFDFYHEIITSICVICLYCLYQPFMKIWAGNNLMLPTSSMILFCIYFYVNHLAQIRSVYSEAAGLWWYFRYLSVTEIIANVILNIILGRLFGVNGILISTIVTAFIFSFLGCTIITYKRLFHVLPVNYFTRNIIYCLVTVCGCILISIYTNYMQDNSWIKLIIKSIACILLSCIYIVSVYLLYKPTQKDLLTIAKKMIVIKSRMGGE